MQEVLDVPKYILPMRQNNRDCLIHILHIKCVPFLPLNEVLIKTATKTNGAIARSLS